MNISVNNVNFNGRHEVLYGLKKAAQEARNIETNKVLSRGPRPMDRSLEIQKGQSSMNAYLDMVVNDDAFVKTASDIANFKQEANTVRNILKESTVQSQAIKPLETFSKAFSDIVEKQKIAVKKEFVEKFLHSLKN